MTQKAQCLNTIVDSQQARRNVTASRAARPRSLFKPHQQLSSSRKYPPQSPSCDDLVLNNFRSSSPCLITVSPTQVPFPRSICCQKLTVLVVIFCSSTRFWNPQRSGSMEYRWRQPSPKRHPRSTRPRREDPTNHRRPFPIIPPSTLEQL